MRRNWLLASSMFWLGCGSGEPTAPTIAAPPTAFTAPSAEEPSITARPPTAAPTPPPSAGAPATGEMRCTLRITANAIYVDGNPMSRADAISACRRSAGAVVILAEATAPNEVLAIENEWKTIRKELEQRNVAIHVRGRVEDSPCSENPLARGCN